MSTSTRHHQALRRELGETIVTALADDDITEILLNPDGQLWLDSHAHGLVPTGAQISPCRAGSLLSTVAGLLGRVINERQPVLEAELPLDGSRIEGLVPPVVSAPVFAIRKRAGRVLPLAQYVVEGGLEEAQAEALRKTLLARRNVLISGGPGSGKTTFANALLHEMRQPMPHSERLLLLEDTPELRCEVPGHVRLRTSEHVDLRALVRASLRLRPDRIIVGEVRGGEALDLLKAWNTGNPGGLATLHANSACDALLRLDQLVQEAGVGSQARLVVAAVHVVVQLERQGSRRRVVEVTEVRGYSDSEGFQVAPLCAASKVST